MKISFIFLLAFCVENVFCSGDLKFQILPNLVQVINETENVKCFQESKLFLDNLENLTLWAYESKYLIFKMNLKIFFLLIFTLQKYESLIVFQRSHPLRVRVLC